MHRERTQWLTPLAFICLLAGTLISLKPSLESLNQQIDVIFERVRGQDWGPSYDVQDVRCPPVLAEGERGRVYATLSGGAVSPFHTMAELGGCLQEVTLAPGEQADLACTVRAQAGPEDSLPIYFYLSSPPDAGSPGRAIRTSRLLCSIPVTHLPLPLPSGRLTMMLYLAPGVLGILLGAALWLRRGRPANKGAWTAVISGGVLALGMLVSMVLAFARPQTDRGNLGMGWLLIFGSLMLGLLIAGLFSTGLHRLRHPTH